MNLSPSDSLSSREGGLTKANLSEGCIRIVIFPNHDGHRIGAWHDVPVKFPLFLEEGARGR
jgi:hypothetical protein